MGEEYMRLIKKSIVFFVIINISIYIILTGFLIYSEKQTNYDRLSNKLYYDNILLVENGGNIDWDQEMYSEQYKVYIEISSNCRALIKDTSKWTPPMLSGYYPKEIVGKKAVIGKNVEKNVQKNIQGEQWINIMEQDFYVTGVVGDEYATSCDDLIILFGAQFEKSDLDNIVYIVDVRTKKGAQNIAKSLIEKYPEIQIQHGSIKGTARLTKSSYFYKLLIIELLFIVLFSLFIFGKFRHEKYATNYKVYQIFGIPITYVWIKTEIEVIITNMISLFITSIVGYLTGLFTSSELNNLIFISIVITILSCILETVFFWKEKIKLSDFHRRSKKCYQKIGKKRLWMK